MATLYINASRIKKDTALGSAVDDNLLHPYILIAQDRWILPALGTDLDAKLKQDIIDSTLVGNYETLVTDYTRETFIKFQTHTHHQESIKDAATHCWNPGTI